jgi:putative ABC transport system permease protein
MLRHLFRLMWNRKRTNLLLISEIVCSFVVLFGVGTILVRLGTNYLAPFGFDYGAVWRLNIAADKGEKMPRAQLDEALRQVAALPGVESLSLTSNNTPFTFSTTNSNFNHNHHGGVADRYDAGDDFAKVMGFHISEGRWFQASDDGQQRRPAVISRSLRKLLFPDGGRAIGQVIYNGEDDDNKASDALTVVGVAEDVRTGSDFSAAEPAIWLRLIPHDTTEWEGAAVLMRVQPGAGAELEQQVVKTIARSTRNWLTQIRSLEEDRASKSKYTLAPVLALALVCIFLIVNVALGLFGVLWYNIQQRRSEIGLRRALGSTGGAISRQFLVETLILTFFGVVVGTVLAAQFPLLGAFDVPAADYIRAIGLSAVIIFSLAALCAVQPSRLAARIRPAVALREE